MKWIAKSVKMVVAALCLGAAASVVASELPERKETPVYKADDKGVYSSVEQMPKFPGGDAELMKYISDNMQYPEAAKQQGIEGRVVVSFVVTSTGEIGDVRVVRSKDELLDKEAVRLVKSLPKFTPGTMNGKSVSVWYTVPIMFKIPAPASPVK